MTAICNHNAVRRVHWQTVRKRYSTCRISLSCEAQNASVPSAGVVRVLRNDAEVVGRGVGESRQGGAEILLGRVWRQGLAAGTVRKVARFGVAGQRRIGSPLESPVTRLLLSDSPLRSESRCFLLPN